MGNVFDFVETHILPFRNFRRCVEILDVLLCSKRRYLPGNDRNQLENVYGIVKVCVSLNLSAGRLSRRTLSHNRPLRLIFPKF